MVLLFVLLLLQNAAGPVAWARPVPEAPTTGQGMDECIDLHRCRTLFSILWSCLLTLAACIWAAVHPNIPAPGETIYAVKMRRVKIMVYTLLGPEFLIAWSIRQWLAARYLAHKHKQFGWTTTHGFFAQMGGFLLYRNGHPYCTLTPSKLHELSRRRLIDFPTISREEIEDKSKGNMISKGLLVLQTMWFTSQCIARVTQGLLLTEIEVMTFAFTALTWATCFFWWNKPLDVNCPVIVHWRSDHQKICHQQLRLSNRRGIIKSTIPQIRPLGTTRQPPMIHQRHHFTTVRGIFTNMKGQIQSAGFRWSLRHWVDQIENAIFHPFGHMLDKDKLEAGATRVPTFYAMTFKRDKFTWALVVSIFLGTAFGGMHCLGWTSPFPTNEERILFQVSSIILTCMPLYTLISCIIMDSPHQLVWTVGWFLVRSGMLIYLLARSALFILPFLSLRALPVEAYKAIPWVAYVPHL